MKKYLMIFLLIGISVLSVSCTPVQTLEPVVATTAVPPTAEPATETAPVLELVGLEKTVSLTMEELMALPAVEGQAGIKSSTGAITPPELYKGVALKDLLELVGPLDESMGINIVAEDGYALTFSYDQIMNGTFISYDPATGEELKNPFPLTAILAYRRGDQPLDKQQDGTVRVAIISDEAKQVTDGHWSIKWVAKVEVKSMVQDWKLHLVGALDETLDRASVESCVNCHKATYTDDKAQEWVGIPLYLLAGYVDDEIKHEGPAFSDDRAAAGYTIKVVAADGYSAELDIARIARNQEIIVASLVNGNPLPEDNFPLRLVGGDLTKKEQVGMIAEIVLSLEPVDEANSEPVALVPGEGELVVMGLVDNALQLNEDALRALDVVTLTAEHPKKGPVEYTGVLLSTLLDKAGVKAGATKLVFTASDGFSGELDLASVQACATCLVAFDDEAGVYKMVMPGQPSNLWVGGVVSIEIK